MARLEAQRVGKPALRWRGLKHRRADIPVRLFHRRRGVCFLPFCKQVGTQPNGKILPPVVEFKNIAAT